MDQAIAMEEVSREFPNPTLSYSTNKLSFNSANDSTSRGNTLWDRNYDTILAVNQLFEIGGKRKLRQQSAAHNRKAAQAGLLDARRIMDLGVTKSYIAVLLAEADVAVLRESAASLRMEAKIADSRLHAGDISQADMAQFEIAAGQLELSSEAANSVARAARIAVEVLLGFPSPAGEWKPADQLEKLATCTITGPSRPRPDVVAAEENLRKFGDDLGLQKANRIPDLTVQLLGEHNPPVNANTIGIGLSFPLPLWNSNKGNIKVAAAAQVIVADQLGKIKVQAASEVNAGRVALAEAAARGRRYQTEIAPKSADTVKIIRYSYQKGGAAMVELLQAQRTDNDIRLATAQAMADQATAAATLASALNICNE